MRGCNSSEMSSMSMIEWPDWDCCFVISVRWIASCLPVFSEAYAVFLHLVEDVELHDVLCFSCVD